MLALPAALAPLGAYRQFILCKLVPSIEKPGKYDKLPINWSTGQVVSAHDPSIWLDAATALNLAAQYGDGYLPCFVFTEGDPFWFLDIDSCLSATGYNQIAQHLCSYFQGAAVEISNSRAGLHLFGCGTVPAHSTRPPKELNQQFPGLEFYTSGRFVALTGINAIGNAGVDFSAKMPEFVATWFPPRDRGLPSDWSDGPCAEWRGPTDDEDLIRRAMASSSARSTFGGSASFADLWTADERALAVIWPDGDQNRPYDATRADAALAQHLSFWTGKDCERIERLMRRSALRRDKWDTHSTYLRELTIQGCVSRQTQVLQDKLPEVSPLASLPAGYVAPTMAYESGPTLAPGVEAQNPPVSAPNLVHQNAVPYTDSPAPQHVPEHARMGSPGLGYQHVPVAATTYHEPVQRRVTGQTFLGPQDQEQLFKGCVYIAGADRALVPGGRTVKSSQFKVIFGGYSFAMDMKNEKVSRDAWEAFTQSQVLRAPIADQLCFRPDLAPGAIVDAAGQREANAWWPVVTPRRAGDAGPFLRHLAKMIPDERDRRHLVSYLAAMIQHPGVKFMWAPLIQGVEGNGKTILSLVIAEAVGSRYVHWPEAGKLKGNFNGWLQNKIAYLIEDIYLPNSELDVLEKLKPMITSTGGYEIEAKGVDQVSVRITGNFIFNTNHKGGIPKTANDRRIAPFHCAQQRKADLARDGMTKAYFRDLYHWLKVEGFAVVHDYLATFAIEDNFNPALGGSAPDTTSTAAALESSRSPLEQEITEAVEQESVGFKGGWISSMALDTLLAGGRYASTPHQRRAEALGAMGYVRHPHLSDGRVNNMVLPDGGRPRLFVREDSQAMFITEPSAVAKAYAQAQGVGVPTITGAKA